MVNYNVEKTTQKVSGVININSTYTINKSVQCLIEWANTQNQYPLLPETTLTITPGDNTIQFVIDNSKIQGSALGSYNIYITLSENGTTLLGMKIPDPVFTIVSTTGAIEFKSLTINV